MDVTEKVLPPPADGEAPIIEKRAKVAAASEVAGVGWKRPLLNALQRASFPADFSGDLADCFSITHTSERGRVERQLNIRMFTRGDWYTGVALLPHGALRPGGEDVLDAAVLAALDNLESVLNEAMGRVGAALKAGSQIREIRDENAQLRAQLTALEDQVRTLLRAQGATVAANPNVHDEDSSTSDGHHEPQSVPPPAATTTEERFAPRRRGRPKKAST